MSNRIVEELIKKCKDASVANRGAYPMTTADSVYTEDGTTVEDNEQNPSQDIPEPDVIIDPNDPEATPVAEVIATVQNGAVIAVGVGEIIEELVLDKSVTIQGTNAGIPQNYPHEF